MPTNESERKMGCNERLFAAAIVVVAARALTAHCDIDALNSLGYSQPMLYLACILVVLVAANC